MGHLIILLLRYLSSFLDGIAYWLVIKIYNLLYEIAGATLFLSTIDSIGKNIYAILGVVMLFKLAFSLITYIINPDQFTSSDKGFAAVIKNCFIVVILILIVPLIFEQAMKLQRVILEEDIVGRVITGKDKSGTNNTLDEWVGYNMAFNLISGFIRPNDELFPNCTNVMNSSATSFQECMADFNDSYGAASTTYKTAIENADYKLLLDSNIIASEDGDGRFLFDYTFFITTAVGGFTAYILLMFCIDVAVRSVKLAFLQLIAPIPIVSYVDPKGQKGVFDKWVKVCTSTYLDLFIRLAAIYFVVYIIQNLFVSGGITTLEGEEPSIFVIIFMILGSLLFAKQVPQLISDIIGIKLDGKFTLNPMKKASEVPLIGNQLSQGIGFAGRTAKNLGLGTASLLGIPAAAAGSAIANKWDNSNAKANLDAFGNKISSSRLGVWASGVGTAMDNFGNAVSQTTFGRYMGRIGTDAQGMVGNVFDFNKKKMDNYKEVSSQFGKIKSSLISDIKNNKAGKFSDEYRLMNSKLEKVKRMDASEFYKYQTENAYNADGSIKKEFLDENGNELSQIEYMAKMEGEIGRYLNKVAPGEYFEELMNSNFEDHRDIGDEYAKYAQLTRDGGAQTYTTYAEMKDQSDDFEHKVNEYNNKRVAIKEAQEKSKK